MRKHCTTHSMQALIVASLAIAIVGATGSIARAFPGSDPNCAMCHLDTGFGTVAPSPSSLTLLPGQTGTVTFDVANIPGDAAALSLTGLDAAGLQATPDADWRARENNTRYTLGLTADGQSTFDVAVGAGATPGDYPIGVFLAGNGSSPEGIWSAMSGFTISVSGAVIPEPATATLLSLLLGVAILGATRKRVRGRNSA